ncbi:uncharacterized protein LOC131432487 [Malaya genurostris]|uniref:uncharacterized protein LOC131432487 n=1 Tax=Malaya genurostris TaxID=325434 RepID=UPI0026F3E7AB|nr:uncharacterized protein LOC131432487 [Malaya genurostris]
MCKYTNGLFWITVFIAITLVGGSPVLTYDDDYDSAEDDYDVVFDQRQNGTENVRVSVDGIVIAVPAPPAQSDISTLAGAAFLEVLNAQLATLDNDSSDEETNVPSSTTTTTTTTTTTSAPLTYQDQLIPVNLLGQSLSFLFNKGAEIPIKFASQLSPLRVSKPTLMLIGKDEDDSHDTTGEDETEPEGESQKKDSKHKRRYKLKMASLLKPLLQKSYAG